MPPKKQQKKQENKKEDPPDEKKTSEKKTSEISKAAPPDLKGAVLKDQPLVKEVKLKKKNISFEAMQFETDEERSTNILGKLILTSQAQIQ